MPKAIYTEADALIIKRDGLEFIKRTPIFAITAPKGTKVRTTEGDVSLSEDGCIATDGKSVWATFMKENYSERV